MPDSTIPITAPESSDPDTRPPPPKPTSFLTTLVDTTHADLLLLTATFVSGLIDASAYNAWTVFAAMQTGNTMFLALGASNQPQSKPYGWLKSLVSITSFLTGSFLTYRITHANFTPSPVSRGSLWFNFFMQGLWVVIAASLVESGFVSGSTSTYAASAAVHKEVDFKELVPLVFLAMQFGAQIATSRILGFGEIPTTVLTSVYTDIATDPKILVGWRENVKRNRRVGGVVCMLTGGIAGGWISRSNAGLAGALWLAAGLKFIISTTWLLLPNKRTPQSGAV
ncbi:hypothetical protein BJ508DRAFT_373677 [Ascobolus immersus RN42]|uniref:DUF1275 domain protein n=1 Tax=Ascobolus immersus RN42 TaxID=1160509 RepID=A0A3N4IKS5_ASCIM|nr:hypothetical protein BJ508DRAFT_373677 [Ascobolus immersus RN42]